MSQQLTNHELFNLAALTLFSKLYDRFPQPMEVRADDLAELAAPEEAELRERLRLYADAEHVITWLIEEGFVRCAGERMGYFEGLRLTLRGLTVLGYVPTVVAGKSTPTTLISPVKTALNSGVDKAAADGVKALLTEVFSLAASPATWRTVGGVLSGP